MEAFHAVVRYPLWSYQRGSNENANRIIRRFIAKGRDIARFTHKAIQGEPRDEIRLDLVCCFAGYRAPLTHSRYCSSGSSPTFASTALPSLNSTTYGMLETLYWAASGRF
jgi:hypothetical protein